MNSAENRRVQATSSASAELNRIFVADDDPVTRTLLGAALRKWGYQVEFASDGAAAWERLQRDDAPNLVLLDWMMPGLEGPEICERLREREGADYSYVLLLTGRNEQKDLLDGMAAGADDYLTKPVDVHELRVRLRAGRRILELQADLLQAQAKLYRQATHDPLTGILNRGAVLAALDSEINRAARQGDPIAVAMVDVDFFKKVNDAYGHLAGDDVLCEVAARLRSRLRSYDIVGRYGGEEFLIVLPSCGGEDAVIVADRTRTALAAPAINTVSGPVSVTASFGVAATSAEIGSIDARTLLKAADEALYRAKASGRNRVLLAPDVSPARNAALTLIK